MCYHTNVDLSFLTCLFFYMQSFLNEIGRQNGLLNLKFCVI
jgi:hypothetical protein